MNSKAQSFKTLVNHSSIGGAPLGLLNKLRGKIEYMPDSASFTLGSFGSLHHPLVFNGTDVVEYLGITIEPFIRWYSNQNAQGLYFQLKGFGGIMHYEYYIGEWGWAEYDEGSFLSIGAGAGFGYQTWFGKTNNWYLDAGFSLRYATASGEPVEFATWHLSGPGSFLNPAIVLGFKL